MIREYTTVNTFTRGPVPAQIITYLVFLGEALTFFICMYVNFVSTVRQITILVLYIVTMVVQVYLSVVTSCSDPSDSIMIDYRNNPKGRNNLNIEHCLYCQVCASYVKQTSRHCKVCQRCVQNFDHHCMWVNNCVGSKNYNYFLSMTVTTLINLLVYIAGMILLWTEGQWQNYLGSMITVWVYSFIIIVISIMLLNLIGLHIYLIYKGMTTYQFIILQRQEEKQKKQEQEQKERQKRLQKNREVMMVSVKSKNPPVINFIVQNQQRHPPVVVQQVQMISEQIIKQHQNSSDVIFGQPNHEHEQQVEQKTQKSSFTSRRNQQVHHQTLETGQNLRNQEQDPGSLSSKRQIKQNVSEFFTKNKSLKFFIGDQIGAKPYQTKSKTVNVKQKLYQSARPAENKAVLNNIVKSDGKSMSQYVSARR